ncbi:MAG TPA: glycoside hydrolase family 43 protein [Candidatus Acetatifactor stercoripullorum]|uniref:Glycoside hydrolase family 43 protein n=1 Tax=Candidatus Acetatifactor stercoripullorum TaxID=2838414 RepID=A0A9D1UB12_9FIRM|nr:glycoside hydrolase family 43 protein [Candidatus Acetatifactor stercoripullorum]HIW81222.1 glycoside hydrolase family 43 protein [Candidatus Acetatifactor stercoripullorum]
MKEAGYLFAHFIGEEKDGEQIYFSLSRDGLHWQDLNQGRPVLRSNVGERGARDPFLLRSPFPEKEGEKYYLIATDLRIEAGKGWEAAQYEGSRDILVWESFDLVHWTGPFPRTVGVEGAGCVWAPEAVYDDEKDAVLVFWASMVKLAGDTNPKQRIYGAYTRNFREFTEPFVFLEKENHVIDSTIIHVKEGYYRYTKDETTKRICVDFGRTLEPEAFVELESPELAQLYGVEGPEIFPLNHTQGWCLMVDRFAQGKGYLPLVTDRLSSGRFRILRPEEFDMGKTKKRHGGILNITEAEYQALAAAWPGKDGGKDEA